MQGIEPDFKRIRVNGVELAFFERGTPGPEEPTLLFVHATGFHARIWDRIIESFAGCHVLALDQRGHGRSEKRIIEHWRVFGEDLAALVAALGLENVIGIGHSMGGHALVDAAAKSGAFARLLLLDPTIAPPESYANPPPEYAAGGTHPGAKRKRLFASPDEMVERLSRKGGYQLFEPRILRDYCQHGLEKLASGEYRLLCPPEIEASVYMTARTNGGVHDSARALDIPVTIIRAQLPPAERSQMDFASSPTWPELVGEFNRGRDLYYPECSHFIPMQMPDQVIRALQEEVDAWHADR